jgi:transcriptional repressor NrdR
MRCPFCGHIEDKVVDSRESREGDAIRRRRECLKCGRRFTSYERLE